MLHKINSITQKVLSEIINDPDYLEYLAERIENVIHERNKIKMLSGLLQDWTRNLLDDFEHQSLDEDDTESFIQSIYDSVQFSELAKRIFMRLPQKEKLEYETAVLKRELTENGIKFRYCEMNNEFYISQDFQIVCFDGDDQVYNFYDIDNCHSKNFDVVEEIIEFVKSYNKQGV